jgi:hypothetical protein
MCDQEREIKEEAGRSGRSSWKRQLEAPSSKANCLNPTVAPYKKKVAAHSYYGSATAGLVVLLPRSLLVVNVEQMKGWTVRLVKCSVGTWYLNRGWDKLSKIPASFQVSVGGPGLPLACGCSPLRGAGGRVLGIIQRSGGDMNQFLGRAEEAAESRGYRRLPGSFVSERGAGLLCRQKTTFFFSYLE